MIDGMDLVLERMKMYPEEFVESRKWHDIIGRVIDVLEEDELKTLTAAARQAQRDWFKGAVLRTLAGHNDNRTSIAEPETFYGNSLAEALERHQRHKNEVIAKNYLSGAITAGPLTASTTVNAQFKHASYP
jgi:hypothetical protein